MRFVVLSLIAVGLCFAAKDRTWIPGKVIAIEQIPGRAAMRMPPSENYVIRTGTAEYTLQHAARTYFQDPPKALVSVGDGVQIALEGKNAVLKTPTIEKKLRIFKRSTLR